MNIYIMIYKLGEACINCIYGCISRPHVFERLKATSHMSQGPWPCKCKGPLVSSNGHTIDMVCWNLCQACILEAGLMQILVDRET